ncbi:TonB family protein [Phaeobacter italicus]|nr:TonB family protein [Phaeobacter italicus]
MMRRRRAAKTVAVALAVTAHGVLAYTLAPAKGEILMEAGQGSSEVRLGTAFKDMAVGTASASPPQLDTKIVTAQEKPLVQPHRPTIANPSARPTVDRTHAVQRLTSRSADTAPTVAARRPSPQQDTAKPAEKVAPQSAVTRVAPKAAQPAPTKPQQSRRGGAQSATAGDTSGRAEAKATRRGQPDATAAQTQGNAAASNYPGQVMRKLARAGKPRVKSRGVALISFTIGANGGLTSVSLSQASGSAALDKAAVQLVRRADPFPKPPAGARRSFSVKIQGR